MINNVELHSNHICFLDSLCNTKGPFRRLDSYNSYLDQPAHQTGVYVGFVNPSADTGRLLLSLSEIQSISCLEDHWLEGIAVEVLL